MMTHWCCFYRLAHSCDARDVLLDWNSLTRQSEFSITTNWVAPSQNSKCPGSTICKDLRWFVDVISVDWLVHLCDAHDVLLDWNSLAHQSAISITTTWLDSFRTSISQAVTPSFIVPSIRTIYFAMASLLAAFLFQNQKIGVFAQAWIFHALCSLIESAQ